MQKVRFTIMTSVSSSHRSLRISVTGDNNDSVKYDSDDSAQTTLLGLDSAGFRALSLHIRVGQDRGTQAKRDL